MHQLLNTLYINTEGAYLHLDHDTVRVEVARETRLRVPLHHLGAVVCFGDSLITPSLLGRCAEDGRTIIFLSHSGRFRCRVEGPTSGNVLLRRAQHQALDDPVRTGGIARALVAGKIQNCRHSLLRGARDARSKTDAAQLRDAADQLARLLRALERIEGMDEIRGHEGAAARCYFGVFDRMEQRTRRPPRDRINALLSFLYALLLGDCSAAAQGVGLDPQMGYLHTLRPGRPGLALDLMEELRPVLADRLALTLVNRAQLTPKDFIEREGGAVEMTDDGRRQVITAYQERKQDEMTHHTIEEKMPMGLVPHIQARLLARHLRGDLAAYPPFLHR